MLGPAPLAAQGAPAYLGEMPRHAAVALATALLLGLAASTASAAPGDRAAAAAVRQATVDLHNAVLAQRPAILASYRRFGDDPACATALKGMPDDQSTDVVEGFVLPAIIEIELGSVTGAFTSFAARLDQIPMRDAKLRSGRAVWRLYAAKFAQIQPAPADLCARLDAWRQAGYPAASRPAISDPVVEDAMRNEKRYDRLNAKLERSGAVLHKLGVSRRVVDWWTGETLLEAVDPPDDLIPEDS